MMCCTLDNTLKLPPVPSQISSQGAQLEWALLNLPQSLRRLRPEKFGKFHLNKSSFLFGD